LHGDACGFGKVQLLAETCEGDFGIAEAVEEDKDVGGLVILGSYTSQTLTRDRWEV
jgi:hypothetical protein